MKDDSELHHLPVAGGISSDQEKNVARPYDCNASSNLVKPIDFVKFPRMMKEVGFYWPGECQSQI